MTITYSPDVAPELLAGRERVAHAAARIGVHPATVRRWIATGVLPAERVGLRTLYVRPADVDALVTPVVTGGAA